MCRCESLIAAVSCGVPVLRGGTWPSYFPSRMREGQPARQGTALRAHLLTLPVQRSNQDSLRRQDTFSCDGSLPPCPRHVGQRDAYQELKSSGGCQKHQKFRLSIREIPSQTHLPGSEESTKSGARRQWRELVATLAGCLSILRLSLSAHAPARTAPRQSPTLHLHRLPFAAARETGGGRRHMQRPSDTAQGAHGEWNPL